MVKEGSSDYTKWFFNFDWMVLCGTKNGSSMASLEEPFEAPLFLSVYTCKHSKLGLKGKQKAKKQKHMRNCILDQGSS